MAKKAPKTHTLLVANRGEIAARVMRTAKAMGMKTVAVYSEADAGSYHVRAADEAYLIGKGAAKESYINIANVLEAVKKSGATLVHPGYGFLSENTEFSTECAKAGVIFVGPPPSAIAAMGLKNEAKAIAIEHGVPVVPGYAGDDQTEARLLSEAGKIGYPVAIKAVAGGGGRGLRRVGAQSEFAAALASAVREAESSFGDGRVLLEKWIDGPRHIEVQILADSHGNTLYLGERDCTLQRRHQKVIEEAPAPGMTAQMRKAMGEAAVKAAAAVGYVGAGTVEFIVDARDGLSPDRFYFMEMNTRLQVEHPVTEAITGLDLVEWQLRIALGEKLPFKQADITLNGHAIEARIYAEDPAHQFRPSLGRVQHVAWPQGQGVRNDVGYEAGDAVSPFYDAMLAKVIVHAASRELAIKNIGKALDQTQVLGLKTNIAFLRRLLDEPATLSATFDTRLLDRELERLTMGLEQPQPQVIAIAMQALLASENIITHCDVWAANDGFELAGARTITLRLSVEGQTHALQLTWHEGRLSIETGGHVFEQKQLDQLEAKTNVQNGQIHVFYQGQSWMLKAAYQSRPGFKMAALSEVRAPLPGRLAMVLKSEGESVEEGESVAVLEAMKMEHALKAPKAGTLGSWAFDVGSQLQEGAVLVKIED